MHTLSYLSVLATCLFTFASAGFEQVDAFRRFDRIKADFLANKRQSAGAALPNQESEFEKRSSPYLTKKTQKFVVNPYGLPQAPFNIGESYAGNIPISSAPNETRSLFFWFFPSSNPEASDEITLWLNGGPGCSSLLGFLQENGAYTWQPGTVAPTLNPYSWVNLTNVVWVEQPVGVGFTTGKPNIANEFQLAKEFSGFWKNFITAFGMENRKVYVTGESYGGYYVPYIANAFLESGDDRYYDVKGVSIVDPIIGDGVLQQYIPTVPFMDYWQNVMYFNDSFIGRMHRANDECGYTNYMEKYLQFPPPKGPFPDPTDPYGKETAHCATLDNAFAAALEVNPCFNIYHITELCPHLYSVAGGINVGDYEPPLQEVYFNRKDVKKAINADVNRHWQACVGGVFGASNTGRDKSPGPAQNGVLANVIEKTNNTIIGVGELDFLLPVNGTLLAIQNMTWNGMQGFQKRPSETFWTPPHPEYNAGALAGAGNTGYWGTERGLTFYTVQLSGHMIPQNAPGAAYRQLEFLLGRIPNLNTRGSFTTQKGHFTGRTPLNLPGN